MENNKPTAAELNNAEDIVARVQQNKKTVMWCLLTGGILVIIALAWILLSQSGSRKADELVGKADIEMNDSVATALYMDAAKAGHRSGHRAAAMVAINLFNKGEYEQAIKYLDDADLDDAVAAPGVYALKGDCYANLDQLDKALGCFDKAISKADGNPEIVPFILIKKANIYRAQGNYSAEAKAYKTIIDDYPTYVATTRNDIRRFYERAAAQAAQ
ncbi:MAG: hypothetical protein K2M55_09145 [Muribaculaceae bacterium]|nr:hypothetical protein [Muribaculaceae bacterium]